MNATSELIPETAAEALRRWDAGESVSTAEMGGMGPGYEQAIHITAFEIVRELLKHEPIDWSLDHDSAEWKAFEKAVKDGAEPRIKGLGLSGAQYGAACNLASIVVRQGWAKALAMLPDDRHIQVSKNFPG